mmetsp:Transcript_31577/g.82548  ORF Transcript_31577/g.82548 Transcript_31577/m.82548 type:complete len:244 (-) Transcript_31577:821-1552(-)
MKKKRSTLYQNSRGAKVYCPSALARLSSSLLRESALSLSACSNPLQLTAWDPCASRSSSSLILLYSAMPTVHITRPATLYSVTTSPSRRTEAAAVSTSLKMPANESVSPEERLTMLSSAMSSAKATNPPRAPKKTALVRSTRDLSSMKAWKGSSSKTRAVGMRMSSPKRAVPKTRAHGCTPAGWLAAAPLGDGGEALGDVGRLAEGGAEGVESGDGGPHSSLDLAAVTTGAETTRALRYESSS